jgi:hypothetical protein
MTDMNAQGSQSLFRRTPKADQLLSRIPLSGATCENLSALSGQYANLGYDIFRKPASTL